MNRQTIAVLTSSAILGACSDNSVETISVADITVSGYSVPLTPSQTLQLSAQALGRSGQQLNGHTFNWTSSNNTVATVTPTGLVTAMAQGSVTIVATTAGVSGEVTISVSDPCSTPAAHTTGSTVNGTLATGDCRLNNFLVDLFSFSLDGVQAVTFDLTSPQFDAFLELRDINNTTLAFNDDISATNSDARLRVIAPPGTYRFLVRPFLNTQSGTYTVSSVASSTVNVANCEEIWLIRPPTNSLTIPGSITTTDCLVSGYYSDVYAIYLRAGQQVTLTMNAGFDTFLSLFNEQGVVVADNDDIDPGVNLNSRIIFTATVSGAHLLDVSSYDAGTTGAYTLTVQ